MAIGATTCVFVSLGVHGVLTQEIGHDAARAQASIGRWLPAEIGIALFVWSALALGTLMILDARTRLVLLIVGTYHIVWRVGIVFTLQFTARGRMLVPSLANGLHRVAILVAAGVALACTPLRSAYCWSCRLWQPPASSSRRGKRELHSGRRPFAGIHQPSRAC